MVVVKNNSKKEIDRSHKAIENTLNQYKELADMILSDTNLYLNKLYETVRLRNAQITLLKRM